MLWKAVILQTKNHCQRLYSSEYDQENVALVSRTAGVSVTWIWCLILKCFTCFFVESFVISYICWIIWLLSSVLIVVLTLKRIGFNELFFCSNQWTEVSVPVSSEQRASVLSKVGQSSLLQKTCTVIACVFCYAKYGPNMHSIQNLHLIYCW